MSGRKRKWSIPAGPTQPPEHPDSRPPQAAVVVQGHRARRYDGVWCLQTRAGTWRSAWWLRRWPSDLIQVIWELGAGDAPEPAPADQLELFA